MKTINKGGIYTNKFDLMYNDGVIDPESEKSVWISGMEFFPKDKADHYINDIYEDMVNVIPFAKNSDGDIYGWLVEEGSQTGIVVLCDHDDGESTIYAQDISAAIFRRILEFCNEEEFSQEDDDDMISIDQLREYLSQYINAFAPYFDKSYISELEEMIKKPLKQVDDGCGYEYMALISEDELEEIIDRTIYFDRIDEEFNCYDD